MDDLPHRRLRFHLLGFFSYFPLTSQQLNFLLGDLQHPSFLDGRPSAPKTPLSPFGILFIFPFNQPKVKTFCWGIYSTQVFSMDDLPHRRLRFHLLGFFSYFPLTSQKLSFLSWGIYCTQVFLKVDDLPHRRLPALSGLGDHRAQC